MLFREKHRRVTSHGCHDLIRQGATAVFTCDDILVSIAPLLGLSVDTLAHTPSGEELQQPAAVAEQPRNETNQVEAIPEHVVLPPDISEDVFEDISETENTKELSIEEQLQAIPEIIEIPCSPIVYEENEQTEVCKKTSKCQPVKRSSKQNSAAEKPFDRKEFEKKTVDPNVSLEEQVISLLQGEDSVHIDFLGRKLELPSSQVSTALLMLEVSGKVQQLSGMHYRLA